MTNNPGENTKPRNIVCQKRKVIVLLAKGLKIYKMLTSLLASMPQTRTFLMGYLGGSR